MYHRLYKKKALLYETAEIMRKMKDDAETNLQQRI